jgi:anthranilate phosphoribosyltransferase
MEFRKVIHGESLTTDEAQSLFSQILSGDLNSHELAALLGVFTSRGTQVSEIIGARAAIKASCTVRSITVPDAIDVCGTGGDGKDTFNISTCVAFVVAGTGKKVVKNGNYSASSKCGSSNVLEALEIQFPRNEVELSERLGSGAPVFIHAPSLYPALRVVAQVRKELQFRTIFNLLGPLLNPVAVGSQMIGVPNRSVLRLYGEVLSVIQKKFIALTSADGYDEVSLTGPTYVVSERGQFEFTPEHFGLPRVSPEELLGRGSATDNASLITEILRGNASEAKVHVVSANAGLALWMAEESTDLAACTQRAIESIKSGAAMNALEKARRR